jgi:hypothetical protein
MLNAGHSAHSIASITGVHSSTIFSVTPLGLSLVPRTNLYLYSATMCTIEPLLSDLPSDLRLYGLCHYLNT